MPTKKEMRELFPLNPTCREARFQKLIPTKEEMLTHQRALSFFYFKLAIS
jgi:hypothetical protein